MLSKIISSHMRISYRFYQFVNFSVTIKVPGILFVSADKPSLRKQDLVSTSCWERSLALRCSQDSKKQNQT